MTVAWTWWAHTYDNLRVVSTYSISISSFCSSTSSSGLSSPSLSMNVAFWVGLHFLLFVRGSSWTAAVAFLDLPITRTGLEYNAVQWMLVTRFIICSIYLSIYFCTLPRAHTNLNHDSDERNASGGVSLDSPFPRFTLSNPLLESSCESHAESPLNPLLWYP